MHIKTLLPIALGALTSAQTLIQAIAAQNASLSTLSTLLGTQPNLVAALASASNITVLAPSNEALAAFLNTTAGKAAAGSPDLVTALLTYHVLNGSYPASKFSATPLFIPTLLTNSSYANVTGGQRVEAATKGSSVVFTSGLLQTSTVTTANVNFTGGVLHIIDTVLTLPESDADTAVAANLTSLASALTKANLVSTVDGLSDVTIFAPDNAAFAAIASTVANLTLAQLTSILEYHVVAGTVGYSTLLSNTTLKTVGGGKVTITLEGGSVYVNSAKVVTPNVLVANGVVHVIDSVLNPNNTAATPSPSASATKTAASTGSSAPSSVSKAGAAAQALQTGAMGLGALLGGAALLLV